MSTVSLIPSSMLLLLVVVCFCMNGLHLSNSMPFLHKQHPISTTIRTFNILQLRGGDSTTNNSVEDVTTLTSTTTIPEEQNNNNHMNDDNENDDEGEGEDLSDKVHAAMRRLGLMPSDDDDTGTSSTNTEHVHDTSIKNQDETMQCEDGVCTIPSPSSTLSNNDNTNYTHDNTTSETETDSKFVTSQDFDTLTQHIASTMNVDKSIVIAALGATRKVTRREKEINGEMQQVEVVTFDEEATRSIIEYEVAAIARVMEDCPEVQQLVSEGYDKSLARRALAFAEMNLQVARAILIADEEDAQLEQQQQQEAENEQIRLQQLRDEAKLKKQQQQQQQQPLKTVTVDANFDPTNLVTSPSTTTTTTKAQTPPTSPAKKENVVFQATSATLQQLILESPVPVLLDVYADWCGPCKALTPALEQMAIKAGGMFRLVKLNTDEERIVSQTLEVKALPTIFGIRDGKILNSFQGMPRDDEFMKNFMMGLFGAAEFNPKVSAKQSMKYKELSVALAKIAFAGSLPFSHRERLNERTTERLDTMVKKSQGNMATAEESARVVRTLLTNIIQDPFDPKFRKINLGNKVIQAKVASQSSALAILKSVGFTKDSEDADDDVMILGKDQKVANIAPLTVARDAIDKWIDNHRREIAAAARKKRDEDARANLVIEEVVESDNDDDEVKNEIDLNVCLLKLRMEGKNKIHNVSLEADEPLSAILNKLPVKVPEGETVQLTCTARRLIIKSDDEEAMAKTLRHYKLSPAASIVIKIGVSDNSNSNSSEDGEVDESTVKGNSTTNSNSSSLKERAAARKSRKRGEHTMQSIGIYAKDDNAKGELIDGGGGVWYEHDVSDDENDSTNEQKPDDSSSTTSSS